MIGERPVSLRPQRSISGQDLSAYGAGTIGELLGEVAAESGDRSSAVTFLVDGKRVTGLGDIDSYPAEALERVEILPRGSGAQVGAPAGNRVYNIVLKPETRLLVARGRVRTATDGGASGGTADASATRIRRPQRLNAAVLVRGEEALFEDQRTVRQPQGSPPDLARFRSLRPESGGTELSLSAADRLRPWLDGLAKLKISDSRTTSALGLTDSGFGLGRVGRTRTFDLGAQLTAEHGSWVVTLEGGHRRSHRRTSTSTGEVRRQTTSLTQLSFIDLLAHGPVADLGTGPLHLTLGAALRRDAIRGRGTEGVATSLTDTSREIRVGIDLPLSSRSGPWPWLGDLAFRAELRRGRSNEFGDLRDRTFSLRWSPAEWLQLSAQHNRSRTAPSVDLVAEPLIETAGVRYFDPVRDETVDVLAVTGGRLDLSAQGAVTRRLSADFRPVRSLDLLVTAEYVAVRNSNIVSVLPPASNLITRLFPERFGRDAAGRLLRVDLRPVVFPEQREEELRTSVNLTLPVGKGGNGTRLQIAASSRLLLTSQLDVGGELGTVNLLQRRAIGLGGAMRPRHQLDFTLGYSEQGLGLRLTGERRGRSYLGAAEGPGILTFAPLTTFSLRGFVEGSRLDAASLLLRGSRIGLSINNLANRREQVRDGQGSTPLAYQPTLRDPVGRTIEIELRKSF